MTNLIIWARASVGSLRVGMGLSLDSMMWVPVRLYAWATLTTFLLWAPLGAHFDLPTLHIGNGTVNSAEILYSHISNKSHALDKYKFHSGTTLCL